MRSLQGPLEHIWIAELSFGRTKSAIKLVKGVAKAWTMYRPRLPLTVRGLRMELREGSEVPEWVVKAAQAASEKRAPPAKAPPLKGGPSAGGIDAEERGKSMSRGLLLALAARLAFVTLPALPVRVKKVSMVHKVSTSSGLHLYVCRE